MSELPAATTRGDDLLTLYDGALPHVYGYLLARCGRRHLAEDLTAETFLAAVDAVRRGAVTELSIGWLIGVARHKLADHWRRQARDDAGLRAVRAVVMDEALDTWDAELDRVVAEQTLASLSPLHRLVLTLRYVDDLPVVVTASVIGRSVHATESLLTRAKAAFRRSYPAPEAPEGGA